MCLVGSEDVLLGDLGKEKLGWDVAQYTQCNVFLLVSRGRNDHRESHKYFRENSPYNKLTVTVEFAVLGFHLDKTLMVRVKCPYNLNINVSFEISIS